MGVYRVPDGFYRVFILEVSITLEDVWVTIKGSIRLYRVPFRIL